MSEFSSAKRGIYLTIAGVVIAVVIILGGFIYKMSQPRLLSQYELRQNGAYLLETPRRFSEFELIDHRGQPITKDTFKGKWTLIFFGFTHCPDICPTTMATAAKMYKDLGEEEQDSLQIMLLTVDPERDTQEKLAAYVPYFNPDFLGVTGNPYVILKLATELNITYTKVPLENDDYTVDHSGNFVIINPRGDYHGFFRQPIEHGNLRVAWRSIRHAFRG